MRIGYKKERACVLAYRVGARGGVKEYLGGFESLEELNDYFRGETIHGEINKK